MGLPRLSFLMDILLKVMRQLRFRQLPDKLFVPHSLAEPCYQSCFVQEGFVFQNTPFVNTHRKNPYAADIFPKPLCPSDISPKGRIEEKEGKEKRTFFIVCAVSPREGLQRLSFFSILWLFV